MWVVTERAVFRLRAGVGLELTEVRGAGLTRTSPAVRAFQQMPVNLSKLEYCSNSPVAL